MCYSTDIRSSGTEATAKSETPSDGKGLLISQQNYTVLSRISGIPNLDIQLYEQADELLEIGASIALSPNVCRVQPNTGFISNVQVNLTPYGMAGHENLGKAWRDQRF